MQRVAVVPLGIGWASSGPLGGVKGWGLPGSLGGAAGSCDPGLECVRGWQAAGELGASGLLGPWGELIGWSPAEERGGRAPESLGAAG